jgi:hypothetical protein
MYRTHGTHEQKGSCRTKQQNEKDSTTFTEQKGSCRTKQQNGKDSTTEQKGSRTGHMELINRRDHAEQNNRTRRLNN